MATGGISHKLSLPHFIYRVLFRWILPSVVAFRASVRLSLPLPLTRRLMAAVSLFREAGNKLYEHAFRSIACVIAVSKLTLIVAERQVLKISCPRELSWSTRARTLVFFAVSFPLCWSDRRRSFIRAFAGKFQTPAVCYRNLVNIRLSQAAVGECSGRSQTISSDT